MQSLEELYSSELHLGRFEIQRFDLLDIEEIWKRAICE